MTGEDLLKEIISRDPDDVQTQLMAVFLQNYMTNDGGTVSSTSDVLRHVEKRWGNEAKMFLLGYLGGGDFPKMDKTQNPTLPKRDEHGRWITP